MCFDRKASNNDIFIEDNAPEASEKERNYEAKNKVRIHNIRLVVKPVFTYFSNALYERSLVSLKNIGVIKALDTYVTDI